VVERLLAAETQAALGDGFGTALVARDNWVIVGAPAANDGKGAVYIFVQRPDSTWNQVGIMTLPDGAPGDEYGARLAAAMDVLLVGVPGRDSARGAVAVYRRDGMGSPETVLTAGDRAAGDRFGAALAVEGDLALIGAPGPAPGGFLGGPPQLKRGAAYVFRGAPGRWAEVARLTAAPDSVTAFGTAVMVDGTSLLVSAPVVPQAPGRVYRFRPSGDTWTSSGHCRGYHSQALRRQSARAGGTPAVSAAAA
jgi:hypothetical protein